MSTLDEQLDRFLRQPPRLGRGVYIARGAEVVGDVTLGDYASVWYNAVLRGDINRIEVGHHTNLQDGVLVHLADDYPALVGNYVTVGHGAILHACSIGNEVLVGMGAILLDGVVVGSQCILGAGALLTPGTRIPPGSMVLGSPAKVTRELTAEERSNFRGLAEKYVRNAAYCLRHAINLSPEPRESRENRAD